MIGSPPHVKLEVCVDTPAALIAAVQGGADRIELCAALALAGLTPSAGLMALAYQQGPPIYAMIRPRAGDFVYAAEDFDVMRRDIDAARTHGLAGVVLGAARPDGALDDKGLAALIAHAHGLGATLHRVFDATPDRAAALETAIELGFERVLTSGGACSAPEGVEAIAALVRQAAGRISIMAGAGVTAANASALTARTGVDEVHASCSAAPCQTPSDAETHDGAARLRQVLGAQAGQGRVTQAGIVSALRAVLAAAPAGDDPPSSRQS